MAGTVDTLKVDGVTTYDVSLDEEKATPSITSGDDEDKTDPAAFYVIEVTK